MALVAVPVHAAEQPLTPTGIVNVLPETPETVPVPSIDAGAVLLPEIVICCPGLTPAGAVVGITVGLATLTVPIATVVPPECPSMKIVSPLVRPWGAGVVIVVGLVALDVLIALVIARTIDPPVPPPSKEIVNVVGPVTVTG